jgi:lipopolysaccharide export system protein LptA
VSSRRIILRRGSLVLLAIWIAVLVGSYLQRHFRHQAPPEQVEAEPTPVPGEEQPVRVHKGFVYSDTLGIEPNFRIAAREAVEFSSGWYEFRDVQVSLYHDGRVAYGLTADGMRYNPARHEARTMGSAQLSLRGGVALRASGFTLGGPGRMLQSTGPVTYAGPGWGGLAGGARSSLANDTMELYGGVSVTWQQARGSSGPPVSLLAPKLTYERQRALVTFPEGVTVLRGSMEAKAAEGQMQLARAEGELRTLSLEGPVRVTGTLDDGGNVEVHAGDTVVEVLPEGRYRLSAEPLATSGWVDVAWAEASTGWRQFRAWRLIGEGSRTAWEWLEGQGLACGEELRRGEEPRRVRADRMRLVFEDGKPRTVLASDAVRVDTGSDWAEGGDLEFSLLSRSFALMPAEGKRVTFGGSDSMAWCDRLQGEEGGTVVARGQVIGQLTRTPGGRRESEPVRFAAASASASQGGEKLVLEGDARLWQGQRLVRADRLDYDRTTEVVTGRGNVLTTARAVDQGGRGGEIQVRARELHYDRTGGLATYEGDVTLDDEQAQASCQRLEATIDGNGNLILATLDGGVTVRDRKTAKTMTGQRARYVVDEGFFEMWGNPVLVSDPSGDQVKADHLKWLRDSNTVVVLGTEENPSETLYHPKKPVPTPKPRGRKP